MCTDSGRKGGKATARALHNGFKIRRKFIEKKKVEYLHREYIALADSHRRRGKYEKNEERNK
jgi:hypothetical protein